MERLELTQVQAVHHEGRSLTKLRADAAHCMRCPLFMRATQTVFGEGPKDARIMLIGEQPGDREDQVGRPFVGPAGAILNEALAAACIDRRHVYVTNAVKHFKWIPARRRRLHQKPNAREIRACRHWLEFELAIVSPAVVVALGATAAQALIAPNFRLKQLRGRAWLVPWAGAFLATYHPSAVLRATGEARRTMFEALVADMRAAADYARSTPERVA